MRKVIARLAVALFTFTAGVCAATAWLGSTGWLAAQRAAGEARNITVTAGPLPLLLDPSACAFGNGETPEEKAVRLAEEFVARNGYTDLPADRDNLSYESVEWESDVEEILRLRRDSLERKAFGIRSKGRMDEPGWTVVFRYKYRSWAADGRAARAVTMDQNFGNLRVEHKDFLPAGVEKKF
jgi:hypothetical protein